MRVGPAQTFLPPPSHSLTAQPYPRRGGTAEPGTGLHRLARGRGGGRGEKEGMGTGTAGRERDATAPSLLRGGVTGSGRESRNK